MTPVKHRPPTLRSAQNPLSTRGLSPLVSHGPEQLEYLPTRSAVQRTGRLVGEDHGRLGVHRAGDRNALLLTTGQLGRPAAREVAQADLVECSQHVAQRTRSRREPAAQLS